MSELIAHSEALCANRPLLLHLVGFPLPPLLQLCECRLQLLIRSAQPPSLQPSPDGYHQRHDSTDEGGYHRSVHAEER